MLKFGLRMLPAANVSVGEKGSKLGRKTSHVVPVKLSLMVNKWYSDVCLKIATTICVRPVIGNYTRNLIGKRMPLNASVYVAVMQRSGRLDSLLDAVYAMKKQ